MQGPGASGGPGGFGAQLPNQPTPSPWAGYRGTQHQYGRPSPVPSVGDEESNGLGDGSVRRIMASGFRDMKKSMTTARVKEKDFIKVEELPTVRTKKAWLISLSQDVVLASGRYDDHVFVDWLGAATDTRCSWNDFIDSGENFTTLDLKLAEGLILHFRDDRNNKNH